MILKNKQFIDVSDMSTEQRMAVGEEYLEFQPMSMLVFPRYKFIYKYSDGYVTGNSSDVDYRDNWREFLIAEGFTEAFIKNINLGTI